MKGNLMPHDIHERLARLENETKAQTKILTAICRDNRAFQRDHKTHEISDEKRFSRLETDQRWTKRIGAMIIAALHLFKS